MKYVVFAVAGSFALVIITSIITSWSKQSREEESHD